MYSYYVVDSDKNATHPLASYTRTYDDLLWAMLGSDEKEEVATMNHTYENIMRNVHKEYMFSRTRMWMEYIAKDYSSLPPPLNLADFKRCFKCSCTVMHSVVIIILILILILITIIVIFITIINIRLVFRYLLRSLGLNNSEYSHDILIQSQSSASQSPPVV
ncbi:unnamed protein product [Porites evermanni]|uniref:Uncharacterized protein n=1 Tax=Porites evermanni TaxID=104178 RepID=A0ABN8SS65_9CNID|nr:unnamed protein product [Porites evermanni]